MITSATLSRHVLTAGELCPALPDDADAPVSASELDEILRSAEGFATSYLLPLNRDGDRVGSRVEVGRVITPASHKPAWQAYCDGGWLLLDADAAHGGMRLPSGIACAVQEIFDQACPAFGMMPVPIRAGSRLLDAFGTPELKAEWLPRLAKGEWSATICISEPDAGSDVRRMRTRAERDAAGQWTITGEKCWISFGDQDLTNRIGHFLLAKTAPDKISLFLVPDRFDGERNAIVVRRVEEKLGLHLSPTCALGFEGARAELLGDEGRGLQQLFVMIRQMRLATAVQGAGIAARAYATAKSYAAQRLQGGRGPVPVAIETHADIQRLLLGMAARVETLRSLVQVTARHIDLADHAASKKQRAHSAALTSWLFPIVKTLGGDVAFGVASDAIQILGGAGYTREWPVEQCLRDARVLTIFEGTTGIQAQDLLFRQIPAHGGAALTAFLEEARDTATRCPALAAALATLADVAAALTAADYDPRSAEWGATDFLGLATCVTTGWAGARLAETAGDDAVACHLRAVGQTMVDDMARQLQLHRARATISAPPPERFAALI